MTKNSPLTWILLSKVADLKGALACMLSADARQQQLRGKHPDAYDAHFHAAGLASHIQSICTGLEDLLSQACLQHGAQRLVLDDQASKALSALLIFRDDLYLARDGALEPSRVHLHVQNTRCAVPAIACGVRALLSSPSRSPTSLT